jgi:hypothetical protein
MKPENGCLKNSASLEAVCAACSWKSALGAEEILEKLLSLNLERAK